MSDFKLTDLRERVEGASGPDRELDARILMATCAPDGSFVLQSQFNGAWCIYDGRTMLGAPRIWEDRGDPYRREGWRLTASLDAVVALAKRLGFYIRSEPRFHIDGERVGFISHALRPRWSDWRPDDEWFDRGEGKHADQVLSALLALLRALEQTPAEKEAVS